MKAAAAAAGVGYNDACGAYDSNWRNAAAQWLSAKAGSSLWRRMCISWQPGGWHRGAAASWQRRISHQPSRSRHGVTHLSRSWRRNA